MHSAIKLLIGLIVFAAGIYWYAAPMLNQYGLAMFLGRSTFSALMTVFAGVFGLIMIVLGLIIAWIEYEDLKWESREKKTIKKKK